VRGIPGEKHPSDPESLRQGLAAGPLQYRGDELDVDVRNAGAGFVSALALGLDE
jgi:hypothetical protein